VLLIFGSYARSITRKSILIKDYDYYLLLRLMPIIVDRIPTRDPLLTMRAQHRNLMTTYIIYIILYPHFLSKVAGVKQDIGILVVESRYLRQPEGKSRSKNIELCDGLLIT